MALPPDVISQPPNQAVILTRYGTGSPGPAGPPDYEYTSAAAAYASAAGNIPTPFDLFSEGLSISGTISAGTDAGNGNTTYDASAQAATYVLAFYSATCYLKAYWQEVTSTQLDADGDTPPAPTVAVVEKSFEWTGLAGGGGRCLPAGWKAQDDATWSTSDTHAVPASAVQPPVPSGSATNAVTLSVANLRWSCLAGYVPPVDGSANGFPA